jgi:quinolinate synthase
VRSARSLNGELDAKAVLVLRAGTHFVVETVALIAADRHVSIVTMRGERAVLSGGTSLP